MKKSLYIIGLFLLIYATNCSSGKKALEQGDYYKSVIQAVNRLRQKPDHEKSISTLKEAYPLALSYYQGLISQEKSSNYLYKWDRIISYMYTINNLNSEITRCPACKKIITNPYLYTNELTDAKNNAAQVYYDEAERLLKTGNRNDAKTAYFQYDKANSYVPNFKDSQEKMTEAEWIATLKVSFQGIPVNTKTMMVSSNFFIDNVQSYLVNEFARKQFFKLYLPSELKANNIHPDHLIEVAFEMVTISPIRRGEKEIIVKSKDSVLIKEVVINQVKTPIYDIVNAKMHIYQKSILTKAVGVVKIVDAYSGTVLLHEKFPGEFEWINEWGKFNGDERALSPSDWTIIKNKEVIPPEKQDLFVECTKIIHTNMTNRLRSFYSNY